MKTYFRILFLLSASSLFWNCEKKTIFVTEQSAEPITYVSGEVKDVDTTGYKSFYFQSGDQYEYSPYTGIDRPIIAWLSLPLPDPFGSSIVTGAHYINFASSDPIFGLQFWPQSLEGDRQPTHQELESLFEEGKTFPFGKGQGKVDIWLMLPLAKPTTFPPVASRAYYLDEPTGDLTIEAIEDYQFESSDNSVGRIVTGKLVRCTFEGEIGRYDRDQHIEQGLEGGNTVPFNTEVSVPVRGEARFFVEYE